MSPQAAESQQLRSEEPPPASEDIHLPGPSYLPIIVAAGLTLALVGIIISPLAFLGGMILTVIAVIVWVRDVRAEIAELPLDHG